MADKVPSLTPYGDTTALAQGRLKSPFENSWRERLMAEMWAQLNRLDFNSGLPVAVMAAHDCVPECKTETMISPFDHPHRYEQPSDAELRHMSALMQWLGTNIGFNFIDCYVKLVHELWKLEPEERQKAFDEEVKKLSRI